MGYDIDHPDTSIATLLDNPPTYAFQNPVPLLLFS